MSFTIETDYKLATNPVARAIARTKLTKAVTHMSLRIYSRSHGEECADLLQEAGWLLGLIGMAAEREPAVGPDHPGVRVIRGAISAIEQMSKSGKWDIAQARAIEHGVNTAIELNKVIKQQHLLAAWDDMKAM